MSIDLARCAIALFNLGLIYQQQDDLLKTIYFYQEGVTLDPAGDSANRAKSLIVDLNNRLAAKENR